MENYQDFSPSALTSESNVASAQTYLVNLGFDLGPSGADGDWGARSQSAAMQWQDINGYEVTGELTLRQFDALRHQSVNPEVFQRMQLMPFYDNFDTSLLDHLDPARAALVMQAASHLGVKEDANPDDPRPGYGLNTGPAVEQYFESDPRLSTGSAWCAAFGSWVFDQVESSAGFDIDSVMQGNMRVNELIEQIRADSPSAIKNPLEYNAQSGDMLLISYGESGGHYTMVLSAENDEYGNSLVHTIEGNAGDSVSLLGQNIYTDQNTGQSFLWEVYEEADPNLPESWYVDYDTEIVVVDISMLPNYNSLNTSFNSAADFLPTPSADPNFTMDLEQLALLEKIMIESVPQQAQQFVELPTFEITETNYSNSFNPM